MPIKNIIFDFGDVLISDRTKTLEKKYKFDDLPEKVRLRYIRAFQQSEIGKLPTKTLIKVIDETFPQFSSPKDVTDFLFSAKILPPWKLAQKLRAQGYRVIIFSNNQKTWPAEFAKRLNIDLTPFPFLNSARIGLRKPHINYYKLLLKKFKMLPEECVFVDDRTKNLPPAEKLGIHTFHYQQKLAPLVSFLKKLGVKA